MASVTRLFALYLICSDQIYGLIFYRVSGDMLPVFVIRETGFQPDLLFHRTSLAKSLQKQVPAGQMEHRSHDWPARR